MQASFLHQLTWLWLNSHFNKRKKKNYWLQFHSILPNLWESKITFWIFYLSLTKFILFKNHTNEVYNDFKLPTLTIIMTKFRHFKSWDSFKTWLCKKQYPSGLLLFFKIKSSHQSYILKWPVWYVCLNNSFQFFWIYLWVKKYIEIRIMLFKN